MIKEKNSVLLERKKSLESIKNGVDILIIGGGITGAGVFNILSSLPLKVALVEANDFGFGTSSRSSKLIHGGLRYLANGQFSVVRDSVRERDFLLGFPDLVQMEKFLIPLDDYSWSKSSLRFGLWIYSFFSRKIKAKWYSMDEISGIYPYLKDTPQKGGFVYGEGVVDDSKLVLYNILSVNRENAIALNYAEVISIEFSGHLAKSATIMDRITGEKINVPFKILVNSAGPWVGKIFSMMEGKFENIDSMRKMLKLSKGDHIIVGRDLFPPDVALAIRSPLDKRQVFVIPRGEVVIIGTTEKYFDGDISDPRPSEEDIDYLIESVKRYVKGIERKDVINAFSGIRPLFGKGEELGKISREYRIIKSGNIVNIVGGKITTYRTVAMKLTKNVMKEFGISGEPRLNLSYVKKFRDVKDRLIQEYGLKNEIQALFAYDILYEKAFHLEDLLWRREGHFIFSKDSGVSLIDDAIFAMKNVLSYGESELVKEKDNYLKKIYSPSNK